MSTDDLYIIRHCTQLNRCNQRGGRMLSILDLIDAGTLDLDLAAYLVARITRGASFIVGARPGGAGKTTVMCALLNLIPAHMEIVAATSRSVHAAVRDDALAKSCYVCHEIGRGHYFAYLWGADLRAYFSLLEKGHVLAANLHADDLDEAHAQVVAQNLVPVSHFNGCQLLVFLRAERGRGVVRRRVETVYSSDGISPHTLVFDGQGNASPLKLRKDDSVEKDRMSCCQRFLEDALQSNIRTIEETRRRVVDFLEGS